MKLLMIYADKFGYKTSLKTLDSVPDLNEEKSYSNALVGFIQIEHEDEKDLSYIETKLVKNLKWAAGKNNTSLIILHSFAHLSDSKADPETTKGLFDRVEERLDKSDYEAFQTPFGYFLDLDLQAPGTPLARLFKNIQVS
jgi:hypothetical protein